MAMVAPAQATSKRFGPNDICTITANLSNKLKGGDQIASHGRVTCGAPDTFNYQKLTVSIELRYCGRDPGCLDGTSVSGNSRTVEGPSDVKTRALANCKRGYWRAYVTGEVVSDAGTFHSRIRSPIRHFDSCQ